MGSKRTYHYGKFRFTVSLPWAWPPRPHHGGATPFSFVAVSGVVKRPSSATCFPIRRTATPPLGRATAQGHLAPGWRGLTPVGGWLRCCKRSTFFSGIGLRGIVNRCLWTRRAAPERLLTAILPWLHHVSSRATAQVAATSPGMPSAVVSPTKAFWQPGAHGDAARSVAKPARLATTIGGDSVAC